MEDRILNKASRGKETNFLASVSDLMSGLVFIFLLTLVFTILSYREAKVTLEEKTQKTQMLEARLERFKERLTGNNEVRNAILNRIKAQLKAEYEIEVTIDHKSGTLRLQEDAVKFESGRAEPDSKKNIRDLGRVLEEQLMCYEPSNFGMKNCSVVNPSGNTLDAVFIEGHTDNTPFGNAGRKESAALNRGLSASRSNIVYDVMVENNPKLKELKNPKGERLFSISGYGQDRPLPGHAHDTPTSDSANRRIEMRLILTAPDFNESERDMLDSLKRNSSDM
jgi:outer membrane protein OmpA-like peptidoglycan-associated protein